MTESIRIPHRRNMRAPLATRGRRFVARCIDDGLISVPGIAAQLWAWFGTGDRNVFGYPLSVLGRGALVVSLCAWAANMVLLASTGQSIGKRWLGLEVVDAIDGSRVGAFKVVVLREALFLAVRFTRIGSALDVLDALAIFGPRRRCLHDLAATTHVVSIRNMTPDPVEDVADVFR